MDISAALPPIHPPFLQGPFTLGRTVLPLCQSYPGSVSCSGPLRDHLLFFCGLLLHPCPSLPFQEEDLLALFSACGPFLQRQHHAPLRVAASPWPPAPCTRHTLTFPTAFLPGRRLIPFSSTLPLTLCSLLSALSLSLVKPTHCLFLNL